MMQDFIPPYQMQQLTYERMNIVGADGQRTTIGVPSGFSRIGLGPQSFNDLERWLCTRDVRAELRGPYFSTFHAEIDWYEGGRSYELRIEMRIEFLYRIESAEDQVRFDFDLTQAFGQPLIHSIHQSIPDDLAGTADGQRELELCKRNLIDRVRRMAGGLPGEHRAVRTPTPLIWN